MVKCGLDEVDDFEDVSRVNNFVAGMPVFSHAFFFYVIPKHVLSCTNVRG